MKKVIFSNVYEQTVLLQSIRQSDDYSYGVLFKGKIKGIIVCRDEERKEIKPMSQEQVNISKRKIKLNELLIVITQTIDGKTPADILDKIKNPLVTINIVKNIKQKMCDGIMPIYESELPEHRYKLYEKLVNEYKLKKVK